MLELQALTYHDLVPIVPVGGVIPKDGGTLGRSEESTLVLPDPMKSVSRLHLQFSPTSRGLYKVSNISSSGNQAFINGKELDFGKGCVLKEGDKILIGGYVLQVHYPKGKKQKPAVSDNNADDSEKGESLSSMAELESGVESAGAAPENALNPFSYESEASPANPLQVLNECGVEPNSLDNTNDILTNPCNNADGINELLQGSLASPQGCDDESLDPLAFFSGSTGGDLDGILQMDVAEKTLENIAETPLSSARSRSRQKTPSPVPLPVASAVTSDDLDCFLEGVELRPTVQEAAKETVLLPPSEPVTAKSSHTRATPSVKARKTTTTAPSVKARKTAAPPSQDAEALYQAFIEGLGIDGLFEREALDSDFIRLVGRLFRRYVQGTLELMASRAVIKQGVRANVTLIAPERNNPLKFSPDATVAMLHLLGRRIPGFMEPDEAVEEAFLDLRAHQIGIVSGMQSALNHVLDRFNPEVIVGDNKPLRGKFGDVFSAWRKARLWDDYGRYFQKTREGAGDHFQSFFGSAFLEAYEQAISKVRPDKGNEP